MSDPDTQHRCLLAAARSVEEALPPPGEHGLVRHGLEDGEAVLEFAAKAEHLAACVFAVDSMCRGGDLPGVWRATVAATEMACNRTSWPCGCVTWYERASGVGEWVYRRWPCNRHEGAATTEDVA